MSCVAGPTPDLLTLSKYIVTKTYTYTTNAPTNSPPARKADPSKWSGLDAFAFAVEVKRVAEIQSDFVAGAKS